MPEMTLADALRLAINALRDVSESRKMPSGLELEAAPSVLHADAAAMLESSLATLRGHDNKN